MEHKADTFDFTEDLIKNLFIAFMQERKMWVGIWEHIEPEFFSDPIYERMFKIFKKYFKKYKNFPKKDALIFFFKKKEWYSIDFEKIVTNIYDRVGTLEKDEIEFLNEECTKFVRNEKAKMAVLESMLYIENHEYSKILSTLEKAVLWDNKIDFGVNITDVHERLYEFEELTKKVIPSPWEGLNKYLGGGFFSKELYIFGASSSVGKSIALDNVASDMFVNHKKNVLLITLELSELRKCARIDSAMHNIDISQISKPENKSKIINFYENNDFHNKFIIKEFPIESINSTDIKNYLYQLEIYAGFVPDVIVLDYLDILCPDKNPNNNTYENQGRVGVNLRALAQEMDVPIITASQLNRTSANCDVDDLDESKLADSWKKMMVADGLILMGNSAEQRANGMISFKLAKNRNGEKDVRIDLDVNYSKLLIY